MLNLLYSGDHYHWLLSRFDRDRDPDIDQK